MLTMREFPSDPREWIWNDPARLAGVARPRILRWESMGLPAQVRACRENFGILGQERHFRRLERIAAVIQLVRDVLMLDPTLIRDQFGFLASLFQSFFAVSEDPAWVTIIAARKSFHQRMPLIQSKMSHQVQLGQRLFLIKRASRCSITLNDQVVPVRKARFFHHYDLPDSRLRMQELVVHRSLEGDGLGPPSATHEHWYLPASPDKHEIAEMLSGRNPSLEVFRDARTGMQTAPLVTLMRFDETRRYILGRCICLRPYVGELIDLRSFRYRSDYLFRSDRTNQWVLQDLSTSGRYESF